MSARTVIAKYFGGPEPSDYWYQEAKDIIEELDFHGYRIVHESEVTP